MDAAADSFFKDVAKVTLVYVSPKSSAFTALGARGLWNGQTNAMALTVEVARLDGHLAALSNLKAKG